MKRLAQIVSGIALIGTLVPPCLFFADRMDLATMQRWMLFAALLWFIATPYWMEHRVE